MSRSYIRIIKADDDEEDTPETPREKAIRLREEDEKKQKDTRVAEQQKEARRRAKMGKKLVTKRGGDLIKVALKEKNPDVLIYLTKYYT